MVRAEYFIAPSPPLQQSASQLEARTTARLNNQATAQLFARHPFYQSGPLAAIMGTGDGTYMGSKAAATVAAEKEAHRKFLEAHRVRMEEDRKKREEEANEAAKAEGWGGKFGETGGGWVCNGGVGEGEGKGWSAGNTPER